MNSASWTDKGKTVAQLIKELQTFEDQEADVRISVDGGDTSLPISLVAKSQGKYALLLNCQDAPTPIGYDAGSLL